MSDVSFNPKTNWQLNETVNPEDANRWEQGIKDCADAIDDLNDFAEHTLGKVIGEVYLSYSASAADNLGALPLFTGEVIASANTLYPDFYNWLIAHPELQISEADYETAISTYGECPKYVLNTSAHTIRLPKLTNYIKMANTTDGVTQRGAGLPNITGKGLWWENNTEDTQLSGAFYLDVDAGHNNFGSGDADRDNYTVAMDASLSSNVYGQSDTVTPPHTTLYPWVFAYNTAISASVAQAAEFLQALSGKVDNANLSEVECVVESYHNGSSWYRVYSDGWCEQGGTVTISGNQSSQTTTLLKPFVDVNYSIMLSGSDVSGSTVSGVELAYGFKATSSFQWGRNDGYSGEQTVTWEARGYIV